MAYADDSMGIHGDPSSFKAAIPKTIYYCWFGHGELSETAKKSLASWEKYAPGYKIVRCDEDMFDVAAHPWARDAYAARKFAYVADYARFWLIYNYGGVYMDLGSELVRDISSLCDECSPFSAIEELSKTATTGLIVASPRHNPVVAEVLAAYDALPFTDDSEFLRTHTVNEMFSRVLENYGFVRENRLQKVGEWTLLPSDAFNPVYGFGGYHIKKATYSVHHYSASWREPKFRTKKMIERRLAPFIGRRASQVIGRIIAELKHNGLRAGVNNLAKVSRGVIDRRRTLGINDENSDTNIP